MLCFLEALFGFYGVLLVQNGLFMLGNGFQYDCRPFWDFLISTKFETLNPLLMSEILQKIQENSQIIFETLYVRKSDDLQF